LNFKPPKIYAITDTRISGISHVEQVDRLIAGGVELIQLREKQASPRDFYEAARPAVELARSHGVKVIINDRVDIALALKADGVHLGQNDLPPEHARRILGPEAIIGFSTHSVEQARASVNLPVDYIAIGPIFATFTKENPDAVVGLETLTAVKREIGRLPLIAIGGIKAENLLDVLTVGANSAAMVGALISDSAGITKNAEALISLTNR
jgi:thiamine-phosphate pyrophosphorylase